MKNWIGARCEQNTETKDSAKNVMNGSKPSSAFTAGRWKRADAARVCKECIRRHVEAQQPWQCMACTAWKQEDAVMAKHASPQATFYRVCTTCEQTQLCSVCNTRKDEHKFSATTWKRARNGGRVCLACSRKAWGWWTCSICQVKQAGWHNIVRIMVTAGNAPFPAGASAKRYNG